MKLKTWLGALLLTGVLMPALAQRNPDVPRQGSPNAYNLMGESPFNRYVTFNASLRYGVGMPLGTQRNYIDKLSPANVALAMEWQFPRNFSLGLQTGYQYSQNRRQRAVYSLPETGEDVSAVQTRTLTVTPVLASASYYFSGPAASIRPYVQLAGGGAFMNYTNFYGTLADQDKHFAGMIAPAVGIKVFGGREGRLGGELQAQYQSAFYKYNELNNPASLMLSAGLTYRFY